MASARFACAGGSPSGFHETKTRIEPTSKIEPNPLKKYPNTVWKKCVGGGDGMFFPYSVSRLFACSEERPWLGETDSRV